MNMRLVKSEGLLSFVCVRWGAATTMDFKFGVDRKLRASLTRHPSFLTWTDGHLDLQIGSSGGKRISRESRARRPRRIP